MDDRYAELIEKERWFDEGHYWDLLYLLDRLCWWLREDFEANA